MKLAYVDTSSLVTIAFSEPGWEEHADRLENFDRWFSSNLLEAEFRATLAREGVEDDALLAPIGWVLPDRSLQAEIREVLGHGSLRGADLWHLACALHLHRKAGPVAFVTADRRQGEAAAALGLGVG